MRVTHSGHVMTFMLEEGGVRASLVCHQPPVALCRWRSVDKACDCEVYYDMAVDEIGPYHGIEGPTPDLDDADALRDWLDGKHRMEYGGPCAAAHWVNESPFDFYNGEDIVIGSLAVETEWTGDDYAWRLTK